MDNPALTTYPVIPVIANRWSPRSFDAERLVDTQTVGSLFEAARWAPSSGNEQPWRYIVGLNFDEAHRAVLSCLAEGNRLWAANAPLLFVAVSKTTRNDRPNPHFAHDVGASLENLFLQAVHLGLTLPLHGRLLGGQGAPDLRRAGRIRAGNGGRRRLSGQSRPAPRRTEAARAEEAGTQALLGVRLHRRMGAPPAWIGWIGMR